MPKLPPHQPRYIVLAQALIDGISAGRFPVGSLLPTEHDLAQQYSMSRHTVREAMRQLTDLGMISRQAGIGTRVEASQPRSGYVQNDVGVSDLRRYVDDLQLVFSSYEQAVLDAELADFLSVPVGQTWLIGRGTRHLAHQRNPIALCDVYIAPDYMAVSEGVTKPTVPIYVMIEEQFGMPIVEVAQTIEAARLTSDQARRLNCSEDEAALRIERRYFAAKGELVEVAVNLHPASRFIYSSTLRLGSTD